MSEPKLRFPEFTGDWVQHILSDVIVDIADGPFGSNLKLEHYTDKKEARIIQLSNLSDYGWQEENTRYTTFEHAGTIKRCIVNEDELIMGKMMPAGMTIMRPTTDKMYVLSSDCVRIKLDKSVATDEFFLYTTKSEEFLNQIRSSSQGSTRIRTSISKIKNMNLNIPSLPEQQKIGFLFTKLDALIQSAEKELDGYREFKQAMLQKMFPKKGQKVPKIRFPGFTSDWEEHKLGDICKTFSGGTPKSGKSSYYENGTIPFIRSGEIHNDRTELYITEEGLNNSSAKMVDVDDILYALYGATSGEVDISKINGAINQAVLCIKPTDEFDRKFIVEILRYNKDSILKTYLQGGQGNLSAQIIQSQVFNFPSLAEQRRIGEYFQNLDNLIASQQQELDGYKELKKGLLQQMFC